MVADAVAGRYAPSNVSDSDEASTIIRGRSQVRWGCLCILHIPVAAGGRSAPFVLAALALDDRSAPVRREGRRSGGRGGPAVAAELGLVADALTGYARGGGPQLHLVKVVLPCPPWRCGGR